METDRVPIIDLSAFAGASGNNRATNPEQIKVALELREACEKVGFFYIIGHGCSSQIVREMNQSMMDFFDQPLPIKMELEANKNPLWRGYNSLDKGAHSCTPQDKDKRKDLKESFTIGAETDMGNSPMHGPNHWPKPTSSNNTNNNNCAGVFEKASRRYWNALKDPVATRLMQALALSLDLSMDFFVSKSKRSPHPQMVLLRYPPAATAADNDNTNTCSTCDRADHYKAATGCGAHTDCGFLTILTQDQPGLEVKHANGTWVLAPPVEDAFVVNLGDMMAHWTNDRYRSTEHRVSNPSTTNNRHSIPFFWTVDYDTVIEPIPSCLDNRGGAVYPPTTSGEYILQKLGLMYLAGSTNDKKKEEEKNQGSDSQKENTAISNGSDLPEVTNCNNLTDAPALVNVVDRKKRQKIKV